LIPASRNDSAFVSPTWFRDLRDQRRPRVRDQTRSVRRDFYRYLTSSMHQPSGENLKPGSRTFDKP